MSEAKCPLWLIAVPTDNSATVTENKLNTRTSVKALSENFRFSIPDLKVGTIDTLMKLSDLVATADTEGEQLVKKLKRTYMDLIDDENNFAKIDGDAAGHDGSDAASMASSVLLVNDVSPSEYVQNFKWDAARFPLNSDLQTLNQIIVDLTQQYAEDLKKSWSKYSETKTALVTLRRKNQGSLLLRPLSGIIDPDDCIEGEYLSSLMIVVPEPREHEFLNTYASLARDITVEDFIPSDAASEEERRKDENATSDQKLLKSRAEKLLKTGIVIPGSAKCLHKDGGFVLFRVVVLSAGAEAYRNVCRKKKLTVRPFKYDPNEAKSQEEQESKLKDERKKQWRKLIHFTQASFSEAFRAWIHLKAIRIFVESVLRYGLPVNFQAFLLKVSAGKEKLLRSALGELYAHIPGAHLTSQDATEIDFSGLGQDFYPYVYLSVDHNLS